MNKPPLQKSTAIPVEFKKYFWDCDFSALVQPKYRQFVLGRLLHYGGFEAMKWVRRHYKIEEVRDYLNEWGQKNWMPAVLLSGPNAWRLKKYGNKFESGLVFHFKKTFPE